jgi:hypothetical protein
MFRIFVILFFLPVFFSAQNNLVPNYSFEIIDTCSSPYTDPAHLLYWKVPTQGTTDLFRNCGSWNGAFSNMAGYQYPKSGFGYIGLYAYFHNFNNYREYISTQLWMPLEPGKKYLVGFWCSLAENKCLKAANKIGAWFSDSIQSPTFYGFNVINEIPQVQNDTSVILDDTTNNWILISDTITAVGSEKYITIGNFFDDTSSFITNTGISYPTGDSSSYYFIDDVFVYCIDIACDTTWLGNQPGSQQDFDFKLFPNPGNGEFKLEYDFAHKDQIMFEVFDVSGRIVFVKELSGQKFSENLNLQHLGTGLFFYSVSGSEGKITSGKLVIEK